MTFIKNGNMSDVLDIVTESYGRIGSAFGSFVVGAEHVLDITVLSGVNDETSLALIGLVVLGSGALQIKDYVESVADL